MNVLAWAIGLAFSSALLTRWTLPGFSRMLAGGGLVGRNFAGKVLPTGVGAIIPVSTLLPLAVAARGPFGAHAGTWIAVTLGFGMLGVLDDAVGSRSSRGLLGHLRSLFRGELTTGAVKAAFGGLLALYAGFALRSAAVDALLTALGIALAANAVNLLDLRPGRAIKGFFLLWAVAAVGFALFSIEAIPGGRQLALAAAPLGAAIALAPGDLRGRYMMGDAGANVLGAAAGMALAAAPRMWQLGVVAALAALHWYAEKASLSQWIERVPLLRLVDGLGRPK